MCTGTFRTSLALDLCADRGLTPPPLHYRLLSLSTGLLAAISQFPFTPIHEYIFNKHNTRFTFRGASTHLWYFLNRSLFHTVKFQSLTLISLTLPPWVMLLPNIILILTEFPKDSTNNSNIHARFQKIPTSFPNALTCYTDGSKIRNRVGTAYSVEDTQYSCRL